MRSLIFYIFIEIHVLLFKFYFVLYSNLHLFYRIKTIFYFYTFIFSFPYVSTKIERILSFCNNLNFVCSINFLTILTLVVSDFTMCHHLVSSQWSVGNSFFLYSMFSNHTKHKQNGI